MPVLAAALCLGACAADVGVTVESLFCRQAACDERIVSAIASAQDELRLAVYTFNRRNIAEALNDATGRGVDVYLVVETEQVANRTPFGILGENPKVDFRCDGNSAFMHHKFLVVDGRLVLTGSYNYTDQATEQHDENLVVLHSTGVASRFASEFTRVADSSQPCRADFWP